jgi:hypothetical protein
MKAEIITNAFRRRVAAHSRTACCPDCDDCSAVFGRHRRAAEEIATETPPEPRAQAATATAIAPDVILLESGSHNCAVNSLLHRNAKAGPIEIESGPLTLGMGWGKQGRRRKRAGHSAAVRRSNRAIRKKGRPPHEDWNHGAAS